MNCKCTPLNIIIHFECTLPLATKRLFRHMKHALIGLALLCLCVALFVGGVHLFGRYIFNVRSCQFYNIDNIELRTGVNIPKVISTNCTCTDNTKISKFIVDAEHVDLNQYVIRNGFKRVDHLYLKENDNINSTYKVTFNKNTAELIVNLTYKDN